MTNPIEKAIKLKAELDTLRPIDKEQEGRIMQKFRLDWNYHSNHLEGNTLTFGETKALILFGITAQGKPLKDHIEIEGHNEAINWLLDVVRAEYPLTENFIRELHTLLLKQSYEVDAITPDGQPTKKRIEIGKYKSIPNHVRTVTGEIFRFATPEETPAEMNDLMDWYKAKSSEPDVNIILLATQFHYRFIRIHPFDDGNGRTARILMNFILMKFGYPPVIIKTEDKANYFASLRQADSGMMTPFIEYIAQNLVRSLEIMIDGALGKNIDESDDLDKEIALLEQRLKEVGNKAEKVRSLKTVIEIYEDSIERLHQKLKATNEKMSNFYVEKKFSTLINLSKGGDSITNIAIIKKEKDVQLIRLIAEFSGFNTKGFDEFNYQSFILINFDLTKYSIFSTDKKKLEKPYGEQLTDQEINEIVKLETQRHTAFIEEKIKEVKANQ